MPSLGSIDAQDVSEVNVASDFMALYTTRQKYRRPDITLFDGSGGLNVNAGLQPSRFLLFVSSY